MSNEKQFSQGFTPNLPLWSFQLQKDSKLALKTRKDLEIHLITRALKDESFRAELIANPKAVIEQEIGSKLPDKLEITVLEETEDTIYMVLPCNPYEGLSEDELQANLGMTYEDVALWVLEQQRNTLLDEESSVRIIAQAWRDEAYKQELLNNPIVLLEKALGEKVQTNLNTKIFVETGNTLYIPLANILDYFAGSEELYEKEMLQVNLPMAIGSGNISTLSGCPTTLSDCPNPPNSTCGITLGCGSTIQPPPGPSSVLVIQTICVK
ncbi:MAG: NHLP leader peptide family natural product precursor [Dolichospermum sp. DET73]|nr:NHLP leader peptide family natural product precursor [Dolichospermum sp. DET73]